MASCNAVGFDLLFFFFGLLAPSSGGSNHLSSTLMAFWIFFLAYFFSFSWDTSSAVTLSMTQLAITPTGKTRRRPPTRVSRKGGKRGTGFVINFSASPAALWTAVSAAFWTASCASNNCVEVAKDSVTSGGSAANPNRRLRPVCKSRRAWPCGASRSHGVKAAPGQLLSTPAASTATDANLAERKAARPASRRGGPMLLQATQHKPRRPEGG
mmetsp:Transcript_3318/g.6926  ORF Transcript_3318/g.6926 Transcript_3318/m.6926 type:complete len:212 (-) Transcript_3318:33-668(-)